MSENRQILVLDEPTLTFNYEQELEHSKHGLLLYGPYSTPRKGSKIQIGFVGTNEGLNRYRKGVERISKVIAPKENENPNHTIFPGFQAVFQSEWPSEPTVKLQIDSKELNHAICMEDRYQAIYKAVSLYTDPIIRHLRESSESSIDLWIVVIPEDVYRLGRPKSKVTKDERQKSELLMNKKVATRLLKEPSLFEEENQAAELYQYDLHFHNQLKARLLLHKAAVQVIRETTLTPNEFTKSNGQPLRSLQDPASLAWNLATTVFFKIGGQPWKLSKPRLGVCYVGIVFKRESISTDEKNACCGAQMFLDSGDGVVFRGALGPWYSPTNKQFHLSREKAKELMTIIVEAYKNNHNGNSPTELFIHGKTRFSYDEWEGFRDAVPENCNVACICIKDCRSLKLFRLGVNCIPRGTVWIESDNKGYLWSKGFIPQLQTYPGREVPNPLSVEVVRGKADISVVMKDVFSLTKLNYNACIYGDGVPVTLRFADMIGEILTAGPIQKDLPPLPFKFYI